MFQHHHKHAVRSHKEPARMFKPQLLEPYKTDGRVQSYRYGQAIISAAHDSERIYISVDRPLPRGITDGVLAWFGMDIRRRVVRYRCDDDSLYFVQTAA